MNLRKFLIIVHNERFGNFTNALQVVHHYFNNVDGKTYDNVHIEEAGLKHFVISMDRSLVVRFWNELGKQLQLTNSVQYDTHELRSW